MRGGGGGQRWEPEEDRLLAHWQGQLGNRWAEVARHIPGRTGQQCAQRWRHTNPSISKGKWTRPEDELLGQLVDTCGVGRWAEIARHMQGRTDQQCLARWTRHLDPAINRGFWTTEEDAQLLALYEAYGSNWSRVAKCLKVRIPHQCRSRFNILARGSRPALRKRTGSAGSGASSPGQQGRHKKQRPVWEGEDDCDFEDDEQQLEMGYSYGSEANCMAGDGGDEAEEAAALLTSFQRDAGAAAASAAAGAAASAAPAEQLVGQQQALWQWMQQQQQWQQHLQAAAQVNSRGAALGVAQLSQVGGVVSAGGSMQPSASAQQQLVRQLQLGLQQLAGEGKVAAVADSARQHGSSNNSSKSSSSSHTAIADFAAAAAAGSGRGTSSGAPPLFCDERSSGGGGGVGSPTSLEAMKRHAARLEAELKTLPLPGGQRAQPASSKQQPPAAGRLSACTAGRAGSVPAAVVATSDPAAGAAAAACRGSVSGSCSPEVEQQQLPCLDAASGVATATAKAGAGIGPAAGATAAAAAASHVAALLGSAGLPVQGAACVSSNCTAIDAAAIVAALNSFAAGTASSAGTAAAAVAVAAATSQAAPQRGVQAALQSSTVAAVSGRVPAAVAAVPASSKMGPAGAATPQEQALQWLRNQQAAQQRPAGAAALMPPAWTRAVVQQQQAAAPVTAAPAAPAVATAAAPLAGLQLAAATTSISQRQQQQLQVYLQLSGAQALHQQQQGPAMLRLNLWDMISMASRVQQGQLLGTSGWQGSQAAGLPG